MTAGEWLKQAKAQLAAAGVGSPELDCLILLEDLLGVDRVYLLARPELKLTAARLKKLNGQTARRAKHEPLSYIRGKSDFYGRQFTVSHQTLEPRPETETMVELLLNIDKLSGLVIDVGTGSGCLAITAKLEKPQFEVWATDISPQCLKIAQTNAKKLDADIRFFQGDLLEALPTTNTNYQLPTTILANLPYVPDDWQINQAASHEPRLAIFGGVDGLDYYRKLFKQANAWPVPPKYILTESMPPQHAELEAIATTNGFKLTNTQDFIQLFKLKNISH